MSQKFLSDVVLTTLSSGILKVDADGKIVKAVAGTDYLVTGAIGALDDLSDVVISSPSADQILVYGQPLGGDPGVNVWYNKTPNYLTSYTETDPIYTASSWYTTTNNASNWNTAYGWGNHAGLYASTSHTHSVFTQAYTDVVGGVEVTVDGEDGFVPASGLDDGTKFLRGDGTWQVATTDLTGYATEVWVGQQGYLTSFTESDPVFTASDAYNIREADITNWDTAYGWGDHSEAGYITGNETITLSGDVSGSGTTSITVTVSNDSHNHTYSQVSGISDLNSVPNANNGNFRPFVSNFQASNRSGSNYNGGFEVGTGAANYGAQFTFQASAATTAPYYRNKINGTWGSWYRLWGTADFSSTDITNWNTAYGWGNHATAGYITADDQELTWEGTTKTLSISDGNDVVLSDLVTAAEVEAYGYIIGESDTLDSVTDRGATTTNAITTGTHTIYGTNTTSAESVLLQFTASGDTLGSIRTYNAGAYNQHTRFYTSNVNGTAETLAFMYDHNGNVGIGTASPGYKLSVAGSAHSWNIGPHTGGIDLYSTGNISPHYQTTFDWFTGAPGAGTFKMRLDSAGNLGIGTTSPTAKLHVQGTSYFFDQSIFSDKVGIGTASPSAKLHVAGASIIANNTTIDPDSYLNSIIAGNIADGGGWGAIGIGGNAGTGDSWAIGHNGSNLYFGIQNGSAANTMDTYMIVSPTRTITLPQYGAGLLKTDANGVVSVDTATYVTADDQELNWEGTTKTLSIADGNDVTLSELVTAAEVEAYGYIIGESDTLATVTNRGASTTGRINVRGAGNQGGGNIMMGNTGNGTNKWSYLTGTHYNADTETEGFSIIGGLSTATYNAVVIGGSIYESNPATQIQFWTHSATTHNLGGTQQGVITSSGNWGIGTTSPNYKLDVNGGIKLNGKSALTDSAYFVGSPGFGFRWNSSNDAYNNVIMYDNGNMYVRGNVGIGTTSPSYRLHVDNNSTGYIARIQGDTNNISFYDGGSGGIGIGTSTNQDLKLYTNDTLNNGIVIKASGNVGIGTTSPAYALDIERTTGEVAIQLQARDNSSNTAIYFGDNGDADVGSLIYNQGSNYMSFTANAGERMRIDSSGNVGIGTSSPSYKMHVVGSMYASSGAIFGSRITVGGNVENDSDRAYDIGTDASRWRVVYCETLDSAGQHESNLANEEIQDLPTGTVLVWKDGKAVPCSSFANFMKIGVSVNGHNSPLVQGAEPVLCTGAVEEGDYLVTSEKIGHAVAMNRSQVKEEDLFDCVIGKALEAGSGNSHLVKTWINI